MDDPVQAEPRVAVVTGAAGGIGSAIVAALRRDGYAVLPVDLAGDDNFRADIATADGNRAMVEHALDRYGRLDVLVLNAGLQFMAPIPEFPEAEWDRLFAVMAKGPFLAMQAAWAALTSRPGSRIVVTASLSGLAGDRYKAAYVAAKHAVVGLVKVAALEAADHGMTVNAVAPGWVHTPLVDRQLADQARLRGLPPDEILREMANAQPGGRFVEPAEVASVVAFLAGPAASGVNGVCLPVDLGSFAGG